jgi:hypothetical protein
VSDHWFVPPSGIEMALPKVILWELPKVLRLVSLWAMRWAPLWVPPMVPPMVIQ